MAEARWREISSRLTRIGLFPVKGVQASLLAEKDPDGLIDKAQEFGYTGVLTEELLVELKLRTEAKAAPEPAQVEPTGETVGRVIAPISQTEPTPADRPHGLPHFSLDGFPMLATDVDTELDIHFDITGKSTTEGKMADFLSLFNNRLEKLKRIIVQTGRLPNRVISVNQLIRDKSRYTSSNNTATVIGLVNDVRHKGDNLYFNIEDESGQIFCLLSPAHDNEGAALVRRRNQVLTAGLMNDDVVGITGHVSPQRRDMLIVNDIHLPPLEKHRKRAAPADQAVSVAFLSDLHLGSNTFLHAQWDKMAKWFHEDPLAKTIKYLVLSGDVVDGVGIYKNQEQELEIVDVYKQYEGVARLIEGLPDWIETMILPGNHDAVRPAEPQPALDPRIQEYYNSTTFVGNPCEFSLHGVRVLSYHGVSIMEFVSSMRNVTFSEPEKAMAEMLERRHLAPTYGGKTPLSPEPEDHMVIEEIPDIFVTGHVHGHYCGEHKGVTLVHSSTWQDQTDYQRMLGFQPKPCILTVVNLHTHETASIPFA
jgi:DNA polymerase II small subunit